MNINTNGIGAAPVSYGRIGNDSPVGASEAPKASAAQVKDPVTPQKVTVQQVRQAVSTLNKAVQSSSSSLHFTIDESTDEPIVKVVDGETGQMIRQIPSEEVLAVAKSIDDYLGRGALLTQHA